MLLADRFLHRDDGWFDIATAERVAVVVHQAGSRRAQIEWAERCAMLAMLRHPLLRPLVDYGAASATTLFEAYAMHPPLEAPRAGVVACRQARYAVSGSAWHRALRITGGHPAPSTRPLV